MDVINKKYKILEKLGSGTFGSVFKGQNIRTNEFVAIKVERIDNNTKLLKNEAIFYNYLNGCVGIPNVKWFGRDNLNNYMVIELLGISLQDLKHKLTKFPLPLVLKIGIKIIELLKTIHEKGLIHRDIKPDNFLFGKKSYDILYLVDFGFCKNYIVDNKHVQIKSTSGLIGSLNYASIMSHNRLELSRRDDLESLIYMLLYFFYGSLPWLCDTHESDIIRKKTELLNDSSIPTVLLNFLKYVRNMEYEEKPNYYLIINNFKREIEVLSKIS